ncbi:MAG TPA: 16S rRNA (cytosine(967)-C(5))-methyltransferase RsmB [Gammaproteobacteria bacterium]|nr:16S rRNA (cytosine(967)-C(5))-methyltransferase RsmB [Gammaproteobacteria bacterium]
MSSQPRKTAALLVHRVLDQGESLGGLLERQLAVLDDPRQRALAQELAFGTLRWSYRLEALLSRLLRKPLKKKDRDLHALLLVGLYQLLMLELPAHAAVSETVEVARQLGKKWAVGMVNGVLRNAQRQAPGLLKDLDNDAVARWSHPDWWIERLQQDWPDDWQQILAAGNQRPPMVVRVNRLQVERAEYLQQLRAAGIEAREQPFAPAALRLEQPVAVDSLPGFRAGRVSVQDAAAQLCATLLNVQAGHRVLDACAAPGGKTGHILETAPRLQRLLALDIDARRLQKVQDNLQRLQLQADLLAADAGDPSSWWDQRPFDRILLDAPCSASGVVRRHPDIKRLRRHSDLRSLSQQQQRLLESLWPLLASGGMLLYTSCSVFRQENSDNLQAFLERHADASELPLQAQWGKVQPVGRQLLPGEHDMDGFYFACLTRA